MPGRMQSKLMRSSNWMSESPRDSVGPDELKILVRDGFGAMTIATREDFILALEAGLRRANLSLRAYLVPLGISASTPEELTPSDVGHLIRYLKINVPTASSAVDEIIARFAFSEEKKRKESSVPVSYIGARSPAFRRKFVRRYELSAEAGTTKRASIPT